VTVSIAVVCEAPADQRTSCELADRVLCAQIDWIEPETLDAFRCWRGADSNSPYLLWRDVARKARASGFRVSGHFNGQPGELDAKATRRALLLLQSEGRPLDAVILLRDDDGKTQRRNGMRQAIDESIFKDVVVVGLAHSMRECWVLAGFSPGDPREENVLKRLKTELGFDPVTGADRLTQSHPSDPRSPKRALSVLTDGDHDRQAECWQQTDLAVLSARGEGIGLADYLREVRRVLVPLLRPGPAPA